ncbi:MAG: ATP-dependent Clp protease ATP-binding subunit, partial [Clostridia bacterium]|nr:ATP-dependent Clp protease ATP-binding subunit [Clostridia bacterium]
SRKTLGFGDSGSSDPSFEEIKNDVMDELKKAFRPEFLNRIDDIIVFRRLTDTDIAKIASGMLAAVANRTTEMELTLDWTDAAAAHLAKAGFDPTYGARPLRRAIQSQVEDLLAESFLKGEIGRGDAITLDVEDDKLIVRKREASTACGE